MPAKTGSKLNRTEISNVRLDPILKWATELAAARERRTFSSFVEWCVEQGVRRVMVARDPNGGEVSAWDVADECWRASPAQRMGKLASRYPDALTLKERKLIHAMDSLRADDDMTVTSSVLFYSEEVWRALSQFAEEEITWDDLATVVRARIAAG
jgi:hypothetical protein